MASQVPPYNNTLMLTTPPCPVMPPAVNGLDWAIFKCGSGFKFARERVNKVRRSPCQAPWNR
jgi:hypothetical protein